MAVDNRNFFSPNLVIGFALAVFGAGLLLDQLDVMALQDLVAYWPVLLILFGLSVVYQAWRIESGEANQVVVERSVVRPGFVILLVVLGLVFSHAYERRDADEQGARDSRTSVFALMSQDSRRSLATDFEGAVVTSVMGKSRLDLREARLTPGETADIDVFVMWGEGEVIVPDGWVVVVNVMPIMGQVRDRRPFRARPSAEEAADIVDGEVEAQDDADGPRPQVVLHGTVLMGALSVRSF